MPLPTPEPGLVIYYEFLWSHEYDYGADAGEKKRPSVILSVEKSRAGTWITLVTLVPITSRPPSNLVVAIEIPPRVLTHLRLTADRGSY